MTARTRILTRQRQLTLANETNATTAGGRGSTRPTPCRARPRPAADPNARAGTGHRRAAGGWRRAVARRARYGGVSPGHGHNLTVDELVPLRSLALEAEVLGKIYGPTRGIGGHDAFERSTGTRDALGRANPDVRRRLRSPRTRTGFARPGRRASAGGQLPESGRNVPCSMPSHAARCCSFGQIMKRNAPWLRSSTICEGHPPKSAS